MSSGSYLLRSPDWDVLVARLDTLCHERGMFTKSGAPNYRALAEACALSPDCLSAWRRHRQRPSRAALEKVAAYAGQLLSPWLEAAGLDPAEGESVD